jgi:hypothetical protein
MCLSIPFKSWSPYAVWKSSLVVSDEASLDGDVEDETFCALKTLFIGARGWKLVGFLESLEGTTTSPLSVFTLPIGGRLMKCP